MHAWWGGGAVNLVLLTATGNTRMEGGEAHVMSVARVISYNIALDARMRIGGA